MTLPSEETPSSVYIPSFLDQVSTESPKPKRRERYKGTHPRRFNEKYKELNPEKYADDIEKVKSRGQTPAGMHISICMNEILEVLHPKAGEIGLDATLGYGGHSTELLKKIQPDGTLFCTDVDPLELPKTEARLRALGFPESTLSIHKSNYAGVNKLLPLTQKAGLVGFDFILADLGLSSMQIDNPTRGFTFKVEGPLDLRLNPERGISAADFIGQLSSEESLIKLLVKHSEETYAKVIAKVVFADRQKIRTTTSLANAVRLALSPLDKTEKEVEKSIKRTFQAIRIAINDEFSALETFLRNLPQCLKPQGRVAILTFHAGEDIRVELALKKGLEQGLYSSISTEAIRPTPKEMFDNPRSKSARLRWAVRG